MIKKTLIIFLPLILAGSCGYYIQSTNNVNGSVVAMIAMVIVVALNIRKR